MKIIIGLHYIFIFLLACHGENPKLIHEEVTYNNEVESSYIEPNNDNRTLWKSVSLPKGFFRKPLVKGSFSEFLQNLPLKEEGALVQYYNGQSKARRNVYVDVIDLPIGEKDLHQCADAVMRLRAEYLMEQ